MAPSANLEIASIDRQSIILPLNYDGYLNNLILFILIVKDLVSLLNPTYNHGIFLTTNSISSKNLLAMTHFFINIITICKMFTTILPFSL